MESSIRARQHDMDESHPITILYLVLLFIFLPLFFFKGLDNILSAQFYYVSVQALRSGFGALMMDSFQQWKYDSSVGYVDRNCGDLRQFELQSCKPSKISPASIYLYK